MNILSKFTIRTMRKNPKRTIVTIVGIILATAMITAVANLAESFRASITHYMKETKGEFHYCFAGVEPKDFKYFLYNKNIQKLCVVEEVGYALFEESINPDKPYIYIEAMDEASRQMLPVKLLGGRWAEREDEIVISRHMQTNEGSNLMIGDTITLQMGVREAEEAGIIRQEIPFLEARENFVPSGERTYTIVGIMTRPSYTIEPYSAPGYTALTASATGENPDTGLLTVYALFTKNGLKNRNEVRAGLEPLAFNVLPNKNLIQWECFQFSERTLVLIYGIGGIAMGIILVSSVFCIRNSFQISLTEKLRMYGMLSSVGTTAKQRRKLVFYEAICLGMIGIPLGVAGGMLATYILIRVCSDLARDIISVGLVYVFSVPAIVAGAVLAMVTIFFSALRSARKAAKLSPISAIRSQDTIRRRGNNLRVPWIISKFFGIGGVLAYKNLRRSKVKYRTTVISIVVSTAVFIAMNTFLNLGIMEAGKAYEMMPYPLVALLYDEEWEEQAERICAMEEVQGSSLKRRLQYAKVAEEQLTLTEEFKDIKEEIPFAVEGGDGSDSVFYGVTLYCMDQDSFAKYCLDVGVSPREAEGAIMFSGFRVEHGTEEGTQIYEGTIAKFAGGSVLEIVTNAVVETAPTAEDLMEVAEVTLQIPIVCETDIKPKFMQGSNVRQIVGITSEAWMEENLSEFIQPGAELYLECEDAEILEQRIRIEVPMNSYYFNNYERVKREQKSTWLLIAIFLYGFIAVISLIGITNIFNTVTTNMELRNREFAMLRSVGMTGKEFRRMIRLESIFYGGEALLIGIPIGCALSWMFYRVFEVKVNLRYVIPWEGILISAVAVAVLLFVIMRYSMNKINRKNIIEAIQNENI